ncbi:MAG: IS1595 family transposase [Acidobacteria bacterium 13_1_20CM_3_53_8]|nr:MAG: IS1595 family transposase [Acidobacteria bacterium 13_1_20CM_3_53_8]
MQQLNRYYRRSKISERKVRHLVRHFALDLTASHAAKLTGLSRRSVTSIFLKIRERIAEESQRASPFSACEVEVDESYFGARRVRGKRGRGASGKTIVFGIFKRNGCVYTEIVPDCKKSTLQAIIRGRVSIDAAINSDGWRGYDGLVDVGYSKHFRVNHSDNEFVSGTHHVNGIESFWSYAKRRLQKFNGVSNRTFYLHLKECEYRFNNRNKDLSRLLLKLLEKYPL